MGPADPPLVAHECDTGMWGPLLAVLRECVSLVESLAGGSLLSAPSPSVPPNKLTAHGGVAVAISVPLGSGSQVFGVLSTRG